MEGRGWALDCAIDCWRKVVRYQNVGHSRGLVENRCFGLLIFQSRHWSLARCRLVRRSCLGCLFLNRGIVALPVLVGLGEPACLDTAIRGEGWRGVGRHWIALSIAGVRWSTTKSWVIVVGSWRSGASESSSSSASSSGLKCGGLGVKGGRPRPRQAIESGASEKVRSSSRA